MALLKAFSGGSGLRFLLVHLSGAPGGYKEAALLCETLERHGHMATLVAYDTTSLTRYVGKSQARIVTPDEALKLVNGPETIAIFWTNSITNVRIANRLARRGAIICLAVHEPRKKWHNVSLAFRARRLVADSVQATMLAMSPFWMVFSPNGRNLVQAAAEAKGALLIEMALYQKDYFTDDALIAAAAARDWICLAGNPGGSAGHEEWAALAALIRKTAPRLQPVLLHPGSRGNGLWLGADNLAAMGVLTSPDVISDEVIRQAFSRSIAVVRLDRTCTQSGTTPVANMAGAPVIGRNVPGIAQHIVDGVTGFTIDDFSNAASVNRALTAITGGPAAFVRQARHYYTENWGEGALTRGVERLVAAVSPQTALAKTEAHAA